MFTKIKLKFLIPCIMMLPFTGFAATTQPVQAPITITSNTQHLNLIKNTATFLTNVIITQKDVKVIANKVVVQRNPNGSGIEYIIAYGSPVHFSQILTNGRLITGTAQKITYTPNSDILVFTGSPVIHDLNSLISGNIITYNTVTHELTVNAKHNQNNLTSPRVQTILYPTQLKS